MTLTNAPEDWPTRRQKVRELRRWARQNGYDWEFGWCCERGEDTGMLHVHGIQHGRHKIPQDTLQDRWGAIVDIRRVKTPGAGVYAAKDAMRVAGYTTKGAGVGVALDDHLALNGYRAAHWSRGFLHGRTKREALSELTSELGDGERLTYRLEPAWTAAT